MSKAIQLNFAKTKRLDPRITFTRASTATVTDEMGVIKIAAVNQPRFDHDPVTGECKGLLIEEARTNSALYSDDFSLTWANQGSNAFGSGSVVNAAIAPDGTPTADYTQENTATSGHGRRQTITITAGGTYTVSGYFKKAERVYASIGLLDNATATTGFVAFLNFDTGVVTASTLGTGTLVAYSVKQLNGGWFRLTASGTVDTSTTSARFTVYSAASDTGQIYTGDGVSGIYIWGAQVEAGSFPTSYIPTTTAAVTRAADAAQMTGANFSSWYRQDEGTFVVEATNYHGAAVLSAGQQIRLLSMNSGATANKIDLVQSTTTNPEYVSLIMTAGAVTQVNYLRSGNQWTINETIRCAVGYKLNESGISNDGDVVGIDIVCTPPTICSRLDIGKSYTDAGYIGGTIARIAYYPKRLTNAELQGLSSL